MTLGESAIELADNTLDMMVAREMGGDKMTDAELKDEIFLCKHHSPPSLSIADTSDLVAGTETSAVTMSWVSLTYLPGLILVVQIHDQQPLCPTQASSTSPRSTPSANYCR